MVWFSSNTLILLIIAFSIALIQVGLVTNQFRYTFYCQDIGNTYLFCDMIWMFEKEVKNKNH